MDPLEILLALSKENLEAVQKLPIAIVGKPAYEAFLNGHVYGPFTFQGHLQFCEHGI